MGTPGLPSASMAPWRRVAQSNIPPVGNRGCSFGVHWLRYATPSSWSPAATARGPPEGLGAPGATRLCRSENQQPTQLDLRFARGLLCPLVRLGVIGSCAPIYTLSSSLVMSRSAVRVRSSALPSLDIVLEGLCTPLTDEHRRAPEVRGSTFLGCTCKEVLRFGLWHSGYGGEVAGIQLP